MPTRPPQTVNMINAHAARRRNALHRRLQTFARYLEAHGYTVKPPDTLPDVEIRPIARCR